MTTSEILAALDDTYLLHGCPLSPKCVSFCRCKDGQIISDKSGELSCVGLIVSGAVDVYSIAPDGRDIQLNTLKKGDFFGISNLLIPKDLETVLRCRTDTELIFLQKKALLLAMEQNPDLAIRYAACCNRKIQFLIRRIELLTMQSCRGKVIEYLLSHRDENGRVHTDCTREDLARHLGVSRAALFRELAALNARKLLIQQPGILIVPDAQKLEQELYESS